MKDKYEVTKYYGIPVTADNSGNYQFKTDDHGDVKIHTWRTGKHSKGKYQRPGQILLTENNLMVMVVAAESLAFKHRHSEVPMQRLTTEFANDELLEAGLAVLKQ